MIDLNYEIYLALSDENCFVGFTDEIYKTLSEKKSRGYKGFLVASQSVCLMTAAYVEREFNKVKDNRATLIERISSLRYRHLSPHFRIAALRFASLCALILKGTGHKNNGRPIYLGENDVSESENEICKVDEQLLKMISGRALLERELSNVLSNWGYDSLSDRRSIMRNFSAYFCKCLPAVEKVPLGYICNRCGNVTDFAEEKCDKCLGCKVTCKSCTSMGSSTSCDRLFLFHEKRDSNVSKHTNFRDLIVENQINYGFALTELQQTLSNKLLKWTSSDSHIKEALLWAVCGAGKTEVIFASILRAVLDNKKVIYSIPRKDVVIDVSERIRRTFPDFTVETAYGGHREDLRVCDITVCTTHQSMRYYDAFDLCILDEVDAYPYHGCEMLNYVLKRSLRHESKVIYMSATPSKTMIDRVKQNKLICFKLYSRHHGFYVPVPKVVKWNLDFIEFEREEHGNLPCCVVEAIEESLKNSASLFVFVPKRSLCNKICAIIESRLSSRNVSVNWSNSQDPLRTKKCEQFKNKEIDILVTTSILERGITIDNANVIVLGADSNQIFSKAALIQMAGRVGRTRENPTGKAWFFCREETHEITETIENISEMNSIACKNEPFSHLT